LTKDKDQAWTILATILFDNHGEIMRATSAIKLDRVNIPPVIASDNQLPIEVCLKTVISSDVELDRSRTIGIE